MNQKTENGTLEERVEEWMRMISEAECISFGGRGFRKMSGKNSVQEFPNRKAYCLLWALLKGNLLNWWD